MKNAFKNTARILLLAPLLGPACAALAVFVVAMFPAGPQGVANISIIEAQGLFTKQLVSVYSERIAPKGFLTSFFKPVVTLTLEVSIAVRRGTAKVAVDVNRFSDGNRNESTKSTEKIFIPPYFHEFLTANEHRLYQQVIGAIASGQTTFFTQLTRELADDLEALQYKIDRAIELQCAQVFQTGVITLINGDNIDFKRKAASKVDTGAGTYWADAGVNPYNQIADGCDFIRKTGRYGGSTFNIIMGDSAVSDLFGNDVFLKRNDLKNLVMDTVRPPEDTIGAAFYGELVCRQYRVRLWGYSDYYEDASGTQINYIDPKNFVLLPAVTDFTLAFGAVPQMINENGTIPQSGAYLVRETRNEETQAHKVHVQSAPIAIPTAVDQIYTRKVVS